MYAVSSLLRKHTIKYLLIINHKNILRQLLHVYLILRFMEYKTNMNISGKNVLAYLKLNKSWLTIWSYKIWRCLNNFQSISIIWIYDQQCQNTTSQKCVVENGRSSKFRNYWKFCPNIKSNLFIFWKYVSNINSNFSNQNSECSAIQRYTNLIHPAEEWWYECIVILISKIKP